MSECNKKCENCRNQYGWCPNEDTDIEERKPCDEFDPYPEGIKVNELIEILQQLPGDLQVQVEVEGLFAVTGAYENGDCIKLKLDLISW